MKATVLRLGHRYSRDKRISTHIGLVSRAFGAEELVFDVEDREVASSVERISRDWGGDFKVSFTCGWKKYVSSFNGDVVHLTMYGINLSDCIQEIKSTGKDKLIVVGGQKVPSELYDLADYNVAVGNQPHSEVAALAVFMDRLYDGKELERGFDGNKRIVPQKKGKKVDSNASPRR